jgi:hypothetical protein
MNEQLQQIDVPKDPRAILVEYEKSIRQEQESSVHSLKSELGRVKHQLEQAQVRLEKCSLYEKISKKVDQRKDQTLEIIIDNPELVKLIESFAQRYQKEVNLFLTFIINGLFQSEKGHHALVYMMRSLVDEGQ